MTPTNGARKILHWETALLDNLVGKRAKERLSDNRNKRKFSYLLPRSESPRHFWDHYEDEHISKHTSKHCDEGIHRHYSSRDQTHNDLECTRANEVAAQSGHHEQVEQGRNHLDGVATRSRDRSPSLTTMQMNGTRKESPIVRPTIDLVQLSRSPRSHKIWRCGNTFPPFASISLGILIRSTLGSFILIINRLVGCRHTLLNTFTLSSAWLSSLKPSDNTD